MKLCLRTVIDLMSLSFSLQEHTSWIRAVQFDAFQVISGADDETLLTYDFLDSRPPFLRT